MKTKRRDQLFAVTLVIIPALPLVAGFLLTIWWIAGLGALGLVLVAPVSYKLARLPALRVVTLGTLTRDARRRKRGWLSAGLLISFSGIDGSGKSSTAAQVVDEFESMGVKATTVWGRWRPILSYPLMGVLFAARRWRRKDYDRSPTLRRFWAYLVMLDLVVYSALYIRPRLAFGEVVCVDRYLLDAVVELRYDGLYNERAVSMLRPFLPSPAMTFWMDIPSSVAFERKADTREMLDRLRVEEDVESYLEARRAIYEAEQGEFRAIRVDTTQPEAETVAAVTDTSTDGYFNF